MTEPLIFLGFGVSRYVLIWRASRPIL
jgi:hypothetical protein